ncbi:MAG TPA: ABC transporter permease [Chloroflexia bacterium]|nr:ABC transporter permease [Chloroflexia bacterium]
MATATIASSESQMAASRVESGQLSLAWQRFRKHRPGMIGLGALIALVLSIIIVPFFSPFNFHAANPAQIFSPAGSIDLITGHVHILGTDYLGRDAFTRLFNAGRTTLTVALVSTIAIVIIGTIVGAVAGFYGGWVDTLLMRFTDFMLALPLLPMYLFAIRFIRVNTGQIQITDTADTINIMINICTVLILFGWMGLSRLVRGSILSLRSLSYVEAARALGASNRRIIFKHLLPNSIGPIMVAATFALGDFIILEAILAYFGQGIYDPPAPSLGNLIAGAQNYVWYATNLNPFEEIRGYQIFLPSLIILIIVLSVNYIADGLRAALDPHQTS